MINNLANTLLEDLACFHILTLSPFVNFPILFLFIYLWFTSYWYISLLYLSWYLYDRQTPFRGGRRIPWLRNWCLWKWFARYFPIKLHKTADLDPSKNYIFAFHPHGLHVFGASINFGTNATGFDQMFPGIKTHILTLNGQFRFPLFREYAMAIGGGSVNSESIEYKLTKIGPGHSVLIVVGGEAEVRMMVDQSVYRLKLADRKGFIRMALKIGAPLVPVFSFNEHRLLDVTLPRKGSAAYYLQQLIKLICNVEIPVDVCGPHRWAWFFLPYRRPVNTVVGAPLDLNKLKSFDKGQDPPENLVDECHQIYLDTLRKFYDEHKSRFGDENTPLIYS